jgi:hypothetical protein
MANPAFLAASMIEERAADIVEALNDISTSNYISSFALAQS